MRGLILFALSCTYAFGQIQLLLVDAPGSEKPVSTMHSRSDPRPSATAWIQFSACGTPRKRSSSSELLHWPEPLSPCSASHLYRILLRLGLNMDFTVRFAPKDYGSYSANLAVNGLGLLLAGSSTAAPVVSVDGTQLTRRIIDRSRPCRARHKHHRKRFAWRIRPPSECASRPQRSPASTSS